MVGPVPIALCVECVSDFSGGRVSAHVTVCVGVDSGVGVAWVIVEDASVLYGGWRGKEEGGVGHLDRGDRSEGMVKMIPRRILDCGRYVAESCVSKVTK